MSSVLDDKIQAAETQMRARLAEARATFGQTGDKGTTIEDAFRKFLRGYLPRRLEVGHGEIIDTAGVRSHQTDVVVVNEDHPFTFTPDLPGIFFIEGVSAAGEVKSVLKAAGLQGALDASVRFKQMRFAHSKGQMVHTSPSDLERYYACPPWFLFCMESDLTLEAILDRITTYERKKEIGPNGLLDAVFALGRGWLINFGDGKESFQYRTEGGESLPGWIIHPTDSVLFDLLAWVSITMPRFHRFESILARYLIPDPATSKG